MEMKQGRFVNEAANPEHPNWHKMIEREQQLYCRPNDIRTNFDRDYTRVLHSLAYRRLKRKTQVFFNTNNDHVCTRIEHVNHVESVSFTIAKFLGLNTELTKAISIAHDLGHTPFGHQGETVLKQISKQHLNETFWHEKHGLYSVDNLELLEDDKQHLRNLNLTYAVRDGIISHCGEIDENTIIPRQEGIDLNQIDCAGKYQPYTWEACVVKISDKIAYIGRDIEDALRLKFIGINELFELSRLAKKYSFTMLNTTLLIHELIIDLCKNSSPKQGLTMSTKSVEMMNEVKEFNYQYIYKNNKLNHFKEYVKLVLTSIFETLYNMYDGINTLKELEEVKKIYPELSKEFIKWICWYSNISDKNSVRQKNKKIYGKLEKRELYVKAILDFIAGMTDHYAIKIFSELTSF